MDFIDKTEKELSAIALGQIQADTLLYYMHKELERELIKEKQRKEDETDDDHAVPPPQWMDKAKLIKQ